MSLLFSNNEIISRVTKKFFEENLKPYKGIRFSYMIMNKKNPSEVIITTNYPDEWVNIYKENNYQQIDPVVFAAFNKIAPFSWEESLILNTKIQLSKIFNLSKKYNITHGYTFVLHDNSNNLVTLSIIMNGPDVENMKDTIENEKDTLQMLLITAYEKTISLCEEIAQNNEEKTLNDKIMFSPRENDILYWASMGKTYQEVALILGIKTSTVKFHIGNVIKKLGVLNAKHAIRLGVELHLIKPVH
ncbi:LuxR family quorum-sensing system transcriptional regulator ExpR|uniref:LuxR family quorum-sensing system transcriptional regulator ExpR n=2 Tax=Enterobacterales TaxID=91347 RepID=A0A366I8L1_9GAMM|nr:LuxR family transcriptional regulator [Brenneria salicis]NMN90036.1 LuxR family quorum-sensing system transcriptional regulator ExpR [Brenneria salicis ATCC 15712 = DSM 30166]RBP64315.1 LuxR family quorum-sensing system transcriptional regulator ExpR [Brenneria salicis ATCC 15712 = DSM 30166]RLM31461.1 LuxR family transcriptional regulator [Brenneria salicis ATCC 15712 = DSM 30166]